MEESSRPGRQVAIVNLGSTNLLRLSHAIRALGHEPVIAEGGAEVAEAPIAIVGGAGDLGQALARIEASGLGEALRARVDAGLPTLAIHLGALACCEGFTDRGGSGPGLGLLPGVVRRLPEQGVRGEILDSPHVGWSQIRLLRSSPLLPAGGAFYFAHEQVIDPGSRWDEDVLAQAEHTLIFPAALAAGSLTGLMFHPEMSGAAGLGLLARFCA